MQWTINVHSVDMNRARAGQAAVLLVGHGSRDPEALREFETVVDLCAARSVWPVYPAYLEFARPDIASAVQAAYREGVRDLRVVAATLAPGGHFLRDIPEQVAAAVAELPGMRWSYAPLIGDRPELHEVARTRVCAVRPDGPFELAVVARGSSEPAARRRVEEAANALGEAVGAVRVTACYVSVAEPTLEEILSRGARDPIVVFPWFLFTGVLLKRIRALVEAARTRGEDVRLAGHLGPDPLLATAVLRAAEAAQPLPAR